MSQIVAYWLAMAAVCAAGGAALHHHDRLAGLALGGLFGPVGLVLAAVANTNATLEDIRDRLPIPEREGYEPVPAAPGRVQCRSCPETFPRGMQRCPHCKAKAPA